MNLRCVTFTGADDSVTAQDMINISEEYPFVEWGILFGSREGVSRFPSRYWLETQLPKLNGYQLSAHLCSRWVSDFVIHNKATWWHIFQHLENYFLRVQLNFHGQFHKADTVKLLSAVMAGDQQFIFQFDGINDNTAMHLIYQARLLCRVTTPDQAPMPVPLFDSSGGAGILPEHWPQSLPDIYCGYAGGLSPDNLTDELLSISQMTHNQPFWIDMERNVRSKDDSQFDLNKVRQVCEIVAKQV